MSDKQEGRLPEELKDCVLCVLWCDDGPIAPRGASYSWGMTSTSRQEKKRRLHLQKSLERLVSSLAVPRPSPDMVDAVCQA